MRSGVFAIACVLATSFLLSSCGGSGTSSSVTPIATNGSCGTSNGTTLTSAPTANLCTAGTVSSVTGTGPWYWTCAGSNGGTNASCSAYLASYTVTPSGADVSIVPDTVQTVSSGATVSFTVTANSSHILSSSVGGTCPLGSWSGNRYITGPITANCTVTFGVTGGTVRYSAPPGSGAAGHAGTLTDPYQTIWENIEAAGPGDIIYLLPGTFTECIYLNKSGAAGNPIFMTGAGNPPAKGAATSGGTSINCTSTVTGAVYMIPAYVTIENLTIGPSPAAGSGLYLNSYGGSVCHNVAVDHVTIHDASGAGYQSILCGALTLTNSIFYNNGLTYAEACTSGVSLGGNIDDGTAAYNNAVSGNLSYNNGNPANCNPPVTGFNSDGEGIIIDYGPGVPCSSYGTPPAGFQCAATSRTLISNNILYGNQSAGIEVFNGNNVDIVNNTLYQNQTVADHRAATAGEIAISASNAASNATSVNIDNNILVPLSTNSAISCKYFTDVAVNNNLNGNSNSTFFYANTGCASYTNSNNVTGNPFFADAATPNFQLQANSAARGIGLVLSNLNPDLTVDYTGAARGSSPWDAGACEYSASSPGACP